MSTNVRRRQAGLSLIELMIALVIAMLLLVGVVQVFAASRESYRISEGLARVQENARFAMNYLQHDIRMAGHLGCVNDQSRSRVAGGLNSHFTVAPLDFNVSIQGFDGAPPASQAPGLSPAPLAGRDAIVLRYFSGNGVPVTGLTTDTISFDAPRWEVLTRDGLATPRLFGIADCTGADVFASTSATAGSVVVPSFVSLARYGASDAGGQTLLYRAEAVVYYIANGAGGQPSLWRARINAAGNGTTSEELVEGVENLQLRYGMDAANGPGGLPTGYVSQQDSASGVTAATNGWARVGQVQIGLLLASPERASATVPTTALSLFGETVTPPADGRYRATYQSTVALRNRLYGN